MTSNGRVNLTGRTCILRAYRPEDAARLCETANDWLVARWMSFRFPHPYDLSAAHAWIAIANQEEQPNHFVIEVDGSLAGGVGITPHQGERQGIAEFGYWLGRTYWGRGIATEAAMIMSQYAFTDVGMRRLEAHVFAPNTASARVLQKCGFSLDGILRSGATDREGKVEDYLLYAKLASD